MSTYPTETHSFSQANSQKRLYLRGKGYSVSKLDHNKAVSERQRALKLANLNNFVGPILSCLSGTRSRNRLKTLMFLINTSPSGYKRITYDQLSNALDLSPRHLKRIIKFLCEFGYITKMLESHTAENRKPNLYIISDIFKDKSLMRQLKNMYYETSKETFNVKDPEKPLNTLEIGEEFGVTPNKIYKEVINYNSFSRTKTNQNQSSLVLECLFNVGCNYEEFVSRRERPKRVIDLVGKRIKSQPKPQSNHTTVTQPIETKALPKSDMLSYLEQFRKDMVSDA